MTEEFWKEGAFMRCDVGNYLGFVNECVVFKKSYGYLLFSMVQRRNIENCKILLQCGANIINNKDYEKRS